MRPQAGAWQRFGLARPRPPTNAQATAGRAAVRQAAAVILAAAMLAWPALLNGYPIIFTDTAAYLLHTITGEAPWDKTAA